MHIVRPIELKDEEAFVKLALSASIGILSLPRNPKRTKMKLQESLETFASVDPPFSPGKYLFVLENLKTKQIEGCSALHFAAGVFGEDYYYQIQTEKRSAHSLEEIPLEHKLLIPALKPNENASEICTLFLSPTYHRSGMGRLLSLSRLLFIACQRFRFQKNIMAEVRGCIDPSGAAPFWEAIGRHFCKVSFEEFTSLFEAKLIHPSEIMPSFPLYYALLPKAAQECIGVAHTQSTPALMMLEREGFSLMHGVDVTDGGPKLFAEIAHLRIIKNARQLEVKEIVPATIYPENTRPHFISNASLQFKACYGIVEEKDSFATIDQEAAEALNIKKGDTISYVFVKNHNNHKKTSK